MAITGNKDRKKRKNTMNCKKKENSRTYHVSSLPGESEKQPERPPIFSGKLLVIARLVQFRQLLTHVAHGGLHFRVHLGRRFCHLLRREVNLRFLMSGILGADGGACWVLG